MTVEKREKIIVGSILGCALGDAVGLVWEGVSPQRQLRFAPEIKGPSLLGSKGMVSDDTEHTCMVAQALLASRGEVEGFGRSLAWRLRFWLLGLPAGVGFATLRSILKLWMGFSPSHSGVYSAGNGPAMRSAILGAAYWDRPGQWQKLVEVNTKITHSDPRALWGAQTVALAASFAAQKKEGDHEGFLRALNELVGPEGEDFTSLVEKAAKSARRKESPRDFARSLGLEKGVTGFVNHTVPVAIQAWWAHPRDFEKAIVELVRCGGDTDTTAAILGGILGAGLGPEGLPEAWKKALWEWPRSRKWMVEVGKRLAASLEGESTSPLPLAFWAVPFRNLFFLTVVLGHGLRRLFPPY